MHGSILTGRSIVAHEKRVGTVGGRTRRSTVVHVKTMHILSEVN